MEDKLLQKLANIAVVRQHINHIVNSGVDRKNINPIQAIGKELDKHFVNILTNAKFTSDETDYKNKISKAVDLVSQEFSDEEIRINNGNKEIIEEDLSEYPLKSPTKIRPEIKNNRSNFITNNDGEPLTNNDGEYLVEAKKKSDTRPKIKTSKTKSGLSKE